MKPVLAIAVALLSIPSPGRSEDPAPTKFYKLAFVIQEVDGAKVINTREYDVIDAEGKLCSIRTSSAALIQGQSYNVSVSIDAFELRETETGLALAVNAGIVSVPSEDTTPVARKNSWNSFLIVPMKKLTLLFSSDDVSSKHKLQLVLTATPLK